MSTSISLAVLAENPSAQPAERILYAREDGLFTRDSSGNTEGPLAGTKYAVYVALLNQTGENAPVATVLENTLGFQVTWEYEYAGMYKTSQSFDPSRTVVISSAHPTNWNCANEFLVRTAVGLWTDDCVHFTVGDGSSNTFDGQVVNHPVEIRVYPSSA